MPYQILSFEKNKKKSKKYITKPTQLSFQSVSLPEYVTIKTLTFYGGTS